MKQRGLERLYSIKDAADALRISQWTVRSFLRDGRLRKSRIGTRVVIRESALMEVITDCEPQVSREKETA